MIRTVILDLGGVIVPFEIARAYSRMASLCAIPPEEIPARLRDTGLVTQFESGLIESRDFARQICDAMQINATWEQFCDLWTSIFLPDTLVREELLERIRRKHRMLLLSNTNDIHFEMLRRTYPLLRHFDDYVLSYQVKAMKPSPRIYQEAISRAGCRPQECFFTDDVAAYVEGARREGMDAVQFQSAAQLEAELAARGAL